MGNRATAAYNGVARNLCWRPGERSVFPVKSCATNLPRQKCISGLTVNGADARIASSKQTAAEAAGDMFSSSSLWNMYRSRSTWVGIIGVGSGGNNKATARVPPHIYIEPRARKITWNPTVQFFRGILCDTCSRDLNMCCTYFSDGLWNFYRCRAASAPGAVIALCEKIKVS